MSIAYSTLPPVSIVLDYFNFSGSSGQNSVGYFNFGDIPVKSGNITGSGISSGTYKVYRMVKSISGQNANIYFVRIENFTANANSISNPIPFAPELNNIPGFQLTYNATSNTNQLFCDLNPAGTQFTVNALVNPVNNVSFTAILAGVSP
jgi:hypothetical protein